MSAEITDIITKSDTLNARMKATKNISEAVSACRREADLKLILAALQELETRIIALES